MLTPQHDSFLAGFIVGKVIGLTLTFARWIFGLLIGAAALTLVYILVAQGLNALEAEIMSWSQVMLEHRVTAVGFATGFIAALLLGPALDRQNAPSPEVTS